MKKAKKLISLILAVLIFTSMFAIAGITTVSATSYPKIPAFQISRVRQPSNDDIGLCYWASLATVQGYCLGSYTYGGVTTNYRIPGKDYVYTDRADAITKLFKDKANGYAHDTNNLQVMCPVKMTLVTKDIGKNNYTYNLIYQQLAQGKPVIIYTGTHASVIIGYNGSSTTLEPSGFTVMEIKRDGNWWKNSESIYNKYANNPNIDTADGTDPGCYLTLDSWIAYCGNRVQEICYPTNAVATECTFNFNANGGTGTMPSFKAAMGKQVTFPECTFTKEGYHCVGYTAFRHSDSTWHAAGIGWKTENDIIVQGLSKSEYAQGLTFNMNESWTKNGGYVGCSFTLHPIWMPDKPSLKFYNNYSSTNYMMGISYDNYSDYYQSRDTSVYNISYARTLSTLYMDTIKIIATSQGNANGKDLLFKTQTNAGKKVAGEQGDEKPMTLKFKAKSSVDGAKLYFRWGYSTKTTFVTLSTSWDVYTIDMSKNQWDGCHMHPYFDSAGTFYLADFELIDTGANSPSEKESCDLAQTIEYSGNTYESLPTPYRNGYSFAGWYTAKSGGTLVSASTTVMPANTCVYARWIKNNESNLLGDCDFDGDVTVMDATLIQRRIANMISFTTEQNSVADVDCDSEVTVMDATKIQRFVASIIDSL